MNLICLGRSWITGQVWSRLKRLTLAVRVCYQHWASVWQQWFLRPDNTQTREHARWGQETILRHYEADTTRCRSTLLVVSTLSSKVNLVSIIKTTQCCSSVLFKVLTELQLSQEHILCDVIQSSSSSLFWEYKQTSKQTNKRPPQWMA